MRDPDAIYSGHLAGTIVMVFLQVTRVKPRSPPEGYVAMPDQTTPPEKLLTYMYAPCDITSWLPEYDNDDMSPFGVVEIMYRTWGEYIVTFVKSLIPNTVQVDMLNTLNVQPDEEETYDVKNAVKDEQAIKTTFKQEEDVKNAFKQNEDVSNAPVRSAAANPGIKKGTNPADVKMEGMESSSEFNTKPEPIDQDVVMKEDEEEDEVEFVSSKSVRKRKKGKRGWRLQVIRYHNELKCDEKEQRRNEQCRNEFVKVTIMITNCKHIKILS
jgi:hypothetical protein